jgi:hypothetical protein
MFRLASSAAAAGAPRQLRSGSPLASREGAAARRANTRNHGLVRKLRGRVPSRSLHFGVRNVCFELLWRRGVTVLKPLVLSDYLRAEQ